MGLREEALAPGGAVIVGPAASCGGPQWGVVGQILHFYCDSSMESWSIK